MTDPNEYKSVVGLDQLYVAEILTDDAAAYSADTPAWLAPAAAISQQPTVSDETQYADNQPYDTLHSEGDTKVDLTITGINPEMAAKIFGDTFNAASGRVWENAGAPPYFALGFRSKKTNGAYRYYWLLKGRFSRPKEDADTQADKATPKPLQVSFTALKPVHKWALGGGVTDSVKRVWGDTDTLNFDETDWFSQVQVPSVVAPAALALSVSDPVDGAAGVAVDKTITLTFNNALTDDAIYNVVLSKNDGTVSACTNSLDATKKILTINPDVNMAAGGTYLVSYGVTDIYGQHLSAAINFNTAP